MDDFGNSLAFSASTGFPPGDRSVCCTVSPDRLASGSQNALSFFDSNSVDGLGVWRLFVPAGSADLVQAL